MAHVELASSSSEGGALSASITSCPVLWWKHLSEFHRYLAKKSRLEVGSLSPPAFPSAVPCHNELANGTEWDMGQRASEGPP